MVINNPEAPATKKQLYKLYQLTGNDTREWKITKQQDGKVKQENLGGVAFVPLTGEHGHKF